jgi:6-phosphogluconate dehydrogenase
MLCLVSIRPILYIIWVFCQGEGVIFYGGLGWGLTGVGLNRYNIFVMQIGILGVGQSGALLMEKLAKEGHEAVVWNKAKEVFDRLKVEKADYFVKGKIKISFSIEGMRESLMKPRVFWMMQSTKEETDAVLAEIANFAELGDIVVDGGDSHHKDTLKRSEELGAKGIKYVGIGIVGGVYGIEQGFCLMAGGSQEGYEYLRPVLDSLAAPGGGHNYFGTGGAGHYVKMVHNAVGNAMAQAVAEGFGLLEKSPYSLNLLDAGYLWERGGVVRSFLLDAALNVFTQDQTFMSNDGVIPVSGDGKRVVEQSKEAHVPVDVIGKSVDFAARSTVDKVVKDSFAAKLLSALGKQLG